MKNFVLIICILLTACIKETASVPERHPAVPEKAVWAGGADGGAWIMCENSKKKDAFNCVVFFEHDGAVWSKGSFILKKYSWDQKKQEAVYSVSSADFKSLAYQGYDGEFIYLSDSHKLVPHGYVDYPFSKTQGKRTYFRMGKEIKTVEYGTAR